MPKVVFESGNEPDFTVDEIVRAEPLKDGMVRIYIASEWRDGLRIEFSVRVGKARLAAMARRCLSIAAEVHNLDEFSDILGLAH